MKPLVIGLTGGMGAGKSTVVNYLKNHAGFDGSIFDCDSAVHALYRVPAMRAWLEEKFGEMPEDARAHCAKMVTDHPLVLHQLERMFSSAVKITLRDWIAFETLQGRQYVIIDAPLLFETHMDKICDAVVVIHCPVDIRRERIMQRPGMTEEKMELMLERQLKDDDRLIFADHVIETNGSLEKTYQQTLEVHNAIRSRANART